MRGKGIQKKQKKQKTNSKIMGMNTNMLVITLNVND